MNDVTLASHLRVQARANRLANRRLHAAMAPLTEADLHAPRTSFFPSLMATLDHILLVDLFYMGSLEGETDLRRRLMVERRPHTSLGALAADQAAVDDRLVAFCDRAQAADLGAPVALDRREMGTLHEAAAQVLAHLFMHQTHHRGQVHAMLSGTHVKPPQLDDFLLATDSHARVADMAALGWREDAVYGPVALPGVADEVAAGLARAAAARSPSN